MEGHDITAAGQVTLDTSKTRFVLYFTLCRARFTLILCYSYSPHHTVLSLLPGNVNLRPMMLLSITSSFALLNFVYSVLSAPLGDDVSALEKRQNTTLKVPIVAKESQFWYAIHQCED